MISIVDYGAGNTANVKNAFDKIGVDSQISSDPNSWKNATALVLPGVGSFGSAMSRLEPNRDLLGKLIQSKPFLGICLGMQLLFESSEESPDAKGFGILKGKVKKLPLTLPVPHIGWSKVSGKFFAYFVHSYYCQVDSEIVDAWSTYSIKFPSIISTKNILLTQFHPEKSGIDGLNFLKEFAKEVRK